MSDPSLAKPSNADPSLAHPPPLSTTSAAAQHSATTGLAFQTAAGTSPATFGQGMVTPPAGSQAPPGNGAGQQPPGGNAYRPLNVRDALSYLDQVKVQFSDQPDVYNRFLDVMKEFKGQTIDTPGVIDRVSTLFHSHPSLIQGFNTFLPPGYRIECYTSSDPADFPPGFSMQSTGGKGMMLISVTTPSGTVSQVPGGFAKADRERKEREAADRERERERERDRERERQRMESEKLRERERERDREREREMKERELREKDRDLHRVPGMGDPSQSAQAKDEPMPLGVSDHSKDDSTKGAPFGQRDIDPSFSRESDKPQLPLSSEQPFGLGIGLPSGPNTPGAAQILAGGMPQPQGGFVAQTQQIQTVGGQGRPPPMVEFNHAITFVNKIKNRFSGDQETYKQFLEILQTYQKETKDINEVYQQVTLLFGNAPDLLEEFTQFLPGADGSQPGGLFGADFLGNGMNGGLMGLQPSGGAAEKVKRSAVGGKERERERDLMGRDSMGQVIAAQGQGAMGVPPKKRRGGGVGDKGDGKVGGSRSKKPKTTHVEPSIAGDMDSQQLPAHHSAQTQAGIIAQGEVAFFDRAKKFIDDKTVYHEFLKLINLFSQDLIDIRILVERADLFLGGEGHEMAMDFRKLVGWDAAQKPAGGYPASGLIGLDPPGAIENVPMLMRPKVDLNNQMASGPSYRKLPKSEVNLACSGRDPMCWEVLNDEWVSHPTWASEDATPVAAHKRNAYEEALHKTEEERHEYDYHIEANVRTIALLEPIYARIQQMDPGDRENFRLKPGLGGQSKSIYQRIIKKIYGKEQGGEVITALHDQPAMAVGIVLERLKKKDEEWKKAQREWNKVWREVDAKNFYKSLDHQGVTFKANDKKAIASKTLIAEVEALRKEQSQKQAAMSDQSSLAANERAQYKFAMEDVEVLQDSLKLVFSYLDRMTANSSDREKVETFLRTFVPLFFQFPDVDFDAAFADPDTLGQNGDDDADSDDAMSDGQPSNADDDEGSISGKRGRKNGAGTDLRKKLLRQVIEAGVERNGGRAASSTPTPSVVPESTTTDGVAEYAAELDVPVAGPSGMTDSTAADRAETPIPPPADPAVVADAVEKDRIAANESEKTWIQVQASQTPAATPQVKAEVARKYSFFGNNNYFCLFRLLHMMYSRLKAFKETAETLGTAAAPYQPVNPLAVTLGMTDASAAILEAEPNPAKHFYHHLLDQCEKFFDGEIDSVVFEENVRYMFGTQAYTAFTLDKVVAGVIKHVQSILADTKSQELLALLQRDREAERTSTKQQIAYRMQAEAILSPDENMFKVDWIPTTKRVRILLLAKDDVTNDDMVTTEQKWEAYMDSFALVHPTEGLSYRADPPFLRRTLVDPPEDAIQEARSGMGVKISLGSYRLFFVTGTEDYYHRRMTPAEEAEVVARLDDKRASQKEKLEKWLSKAAGEVTDPDVVMA